jgi:hypothetical protein
MRSRPIALICLCAAWLATLGGTAAAVPANAEGLGLRSFSELTLTAPGGLRILVEGGRKRVQVWVFDRTRTTVYAAPASEASGRLRAKLGGFGSIDLGFRPTQVLPVERPGDKCGGFVSQYELGTFSGSFRFRGEDGYVEVDAARARGEIVNRIRFDCDDPPPTVRRSRHRTLDEGLPLNRLEKGFEKEVSATLDVRNGDPDGNRVLVAIATRRGNAPGPSFVLGGVRERQGPVLVTRVGAVRTLPAAFRFDLDAGTASVSPPAPFSGTAAIAKNPDGSEAWTGDLAVDLLGAAAPEPLVGFGLTPHLGVTFQDD